MTGATFDVTSMVTAIDQAIGTAGDCHKCRRPLGDSPSADFCSETCQAGWLAEHTTNAPVDGGHRPDETRPELAPARPLTWLGEPPLGTYTPAGREVLDEVTAFIGRFSVFPDQHCAPTLALWYAHTHAADRFYITPRLVLDSAEPGSGKTRVLEVAAHLVAAPEMTISATPAALFRLVAAGPITILFDEVDAVFNAKGDGNEDLRALLNAGYKNGATVARCVGDAKAMKVQRFPVFAPAALAGIAGGMPDTITTRAITIHMRRRRADQVVEQFRHRAVVRDVAPIRTALAAWVASVADGIGEAIPDMPDGVADRSAEIWEPLLALADAAGGHWPDTARAACVHFVLNNGPQVRSNGVRLLADLRTIFRRHDTDRLLTAAALAELHALDESPWADLGSGKPLDARTLARELGRYGVRPVVFKDATNNAGRGYVTYATDGQTTQVGLTDAWDRYLPPEPAAPSNSRNPRNPAGQAVTEDSVVTAAPVTSTTNPTGRTQP